MRVLLQQKQRHIQSMADLDADWKLRQCLDELLNKQELYWAQRSKQHWLHLGDKNTRFFHQMASWKKKKVQILVLQREDGVLLTDQKEIHQAFLNHFKALFHCDAPLPIPARSSPGAFPTHFDLLSAFSCKLSETHQNLLNLPFNEAEIKTAVFQMGKLKAPGPDGFIAEFYQNYWSTVGPSIIEAVLAFLQSGYLLKEFNKTFICLILKIKDPMTVNDFRPISLCNVIYKIGSKVLANRLREVLPNLIAPNQSAFLQGRIISDNILIAHEVIEFIRHTKKGRKMFFGPKLDMNKAYDRVNWEFLLSVLRCMGFSDH